MRRSPRRRCSSSSGLAVTIGTDIAVERTRPAWEDSPHEQNRHHLRHVRRVPRRSPARDRARRRPRGPAGGGGVRRRPERAQEGPGPRVLPARADGDRRGPEGGRRGLRRGEPRAEARLHRRAPGRRAGDGRRLDGRLRRVRGHLRGALPATHTGHFDHCADREDSPPAPSSRSAPGEPRSLRTALRARPGLALSSRSRSRSLARCALVSWRFSRRASLRRSPIRSLAAVW